MLCNILSHFVTKPTSAHQQATFKILQYIKGSPGAEIFLSADSNIHMKGFNDSNWAGCIDTRRSIIGYAIYLDNSLISWKSKKHVTVSRNSLEVKYKALPSATCELQ